MIGAKGNRRPMLVLPIEIRPDIGAAGAGGLTRKPASRSDSRTLSGRELLRLSGVDGFLKEEAKMRRFAQVFMILASFAALVSTVQPAAAGRYCLQGRHWGFPGNCQFSTRQQCMATASGTNSTCGINPRYAHARQRGTVSR
jgi:hypothetical protein